jgi:hypothetical protein
MIVAMIVAMHGKHNIGMAGHELRYAEGHLMRRQQTERKSLILTAASDPHA